MTDERADRIATYVREHHAADGQRRCHQCDKLYTVFGLAEALQQKAAVVQTFTGRIFCRPDCWQQYRREEGFDVKE